MTPSIERPLDRIEFGEVTFAIPAQRFAVTCAISTEEALPVVTEFAIRMIHVCGALSPGQFQTFFGFTEKETAAVIRTLVDERLVRWEDEQLGLTPYALGRFLDSTDNIPRCFRIQEWSGDVYFELVSFSPIKRLGSGRSRMFVELHPTDSEKESRTVYFAERAFLEHFRSICRKDRAEIYKISEMEPGERVVLPITCGFTVSLDGRAEIRRSLSDPSLEGRIEFAQAISDELASGTAKANDGLWELLRLFETNFTKDFPIRDRFDLSQYLDHVHVLGRNPWGEGTVPILGNLFLGNNRKKLVERLRMMLELPDESGRIEPIWTPVCWLAPDVSFWGRTRGARSFLRDLNRLAKGPAPVAPPADSEEQGDEAPLVRTLLQPGRVNDNRSRSAYREAVPGAVALDRTVLDGKVEVLWVPNRLVCVLYHYHLDHPIAIPIGFVSSNPSHLKAAEKLILEETIGSQAVCELPARGEAVGPDCTAEFAALGEVLGGNGERDPEKS